MARIIDFASFKRPNTPDHKVRLTGPSGRAYVDYELALDLEVEGGFVLRPSQSATVIQFPRHD